MLILDRERRKRRGKGQANAQVSFAAAKGTPIGYYNRCKYSTSLFIKIYLFLNFLPAVRRFMRNLGHHSHGWVGNLVALEAKL